jgi:hypothetical protein
MLESHDGTAGADSGGKHEPVSDIDTVSMGSLIALDPNRPIRQLKTPFRAAQIPAVIVDRLAWSQASRKAMRRRDFIKVIAGSAAIRSLAARAQERHIAGGSAGKS